MGQLLQEVGITITVITTKTDDDDHPGYAAPSSGYGNAYSARSGEGVELTPEQEALFPELGELREQIEGLQVLGNIS